MISFRADQRCRVQRVNEDKKVCMEACCCRGHLKQREGCGKVCSEMFDGDDRGVLTFWLWLCCFRLIKVVY